MREELHSQADTKQRPVALRLLVQVMVQRARPQRLDRRPKRADPRQQQHIARIEYRTLVADPATHVQLVQGLPDRGVIADAVVNDPDGNPAHRPTPTWKRRRIEPSACTAKSSRFTAACTCDQNCCTEMSMNSQKLAMYCGAQLSS